MQTHVALLRGVNVGGHNRVPMADLRDLHERLGHRDVATYIQSGNVVFDAPDDPVSITTEVEAAVRDRFGIEIPVILRAPSDLTAAVASSPYRDGTDPARVAIAFLARSPGAARAESVDPTAHDPDRFTISGREIHLHCPTGFGRSMLTNAWLERELAVVSTIRGWKTVQALIRLCEARPV